MDWSIAESKIREKIKSGANLNTSKSTYRYLLSVDALLQSVRYKYKNDIGFIVCIGKTAKIGIPWKILQDCFNQLNSSIGYNGKYFRKYYPLQAQDHPCHVHVIGQIFIVAEIAYLEGDTYYLKEN